MADKHWYVLKVRSGFEAVVAERLRKLGLEVFVPEQKAIQHQASPHRQRHSAGYVYWRFTLDKRRSVTSIPGVLDIGGTVDPASFDGEVSVLPTRKGFRS